MAEEILMAAGIAAALCAAFGFVGVIVWLVWKSKRDPFRPYPFFDPDFVHVGITPRQLEALKPLALELRFMQWIPRDENSVIDCTYYAMTREEFITFFAVLAKHVKIMIADAAKKEETFLRGDTFALSEMLIGLTEIRRALSPDNTLPDELRMPLQTAVDSMAT